MFHSIGQIFQSTIYGEEFACATLSCLVVQPFLLAMPSDVHLAIKPRTTVQISLRFCCSARLVIRILFLKFQTLGNQINS